MNSDRIELNPPPQIVFSDYQQEMLVRADTFAQEFFKIADDEGRVRSGGHGYDHNQRVAGMAGVLAVKEGHDPFLPVFTSLLFDIGRTGTDPRSKSWLHGQLSVEMAADFLNSLPLPDTHRELVANAMEDHPILNENVRQNFLVKIVQDADRLDTLGALGPVRAAAHRWHLPLFADNIDTSSAEAELTTIYQDFAHRVLEWEKSLWTATAREIARPRTLFLRQFIEEYRTEASFMHQAFRSLGL